MTEQDASPTLTAFRLSIPWVCQDGVVHTQQLTCFIYSFALPCSTSLYSPLTHNSPYVYFIPQKTLGFPKTCSLHSHLPEEKEGSKWLWIVLKRQKHLQTGPRNCQRFFKWSTSLMQKKRNLQLFSDWEWIQTLSPRAITPCLQLEEKENKGLIILPWDANNMRIFPCGIFHTVMYQTKF